jgi:4-hydroxybenzoate polyprenyltransferase
MKQAIYIFSLYIGAVTFFTLSYFGQAAEISLSIALLVILATGAIIYAANKSEERKRPLNF